MSRPSGPPPAIHGYSRPRAWLLLSPELVRPLSRRYAAPWGRKPRLGSSGALWPTQDRRDSLSTARNRPAAAALESQSAYGLLRSASAAVKRMVRANPLVR